MENVLELGNEFKINCLRSFFNIVEDNMEKFKSNPNYFYEIKNFYTNFALSFVDETFVRKTLMDEYTKNKLILIIDLIESILKSYLEDKEIKLEIDCDSDECNNPNKIIDIVFRMYDIYDNFRNCEIRSYILEEQSKRIEIEFRKFELLYGVILENYKKTFYMKIGYAFVDFKGNILNIENYFSNVLFESNDLVGKNLFHYMSSYSKVILREKFGANLLDFKNDKEKIKFAFTIDLQKNLNKKYFDEHKIENKILKYFNSIKTLSCRASIIIDCNKNESMNLIPCVMLEVRQSTFRHNFDEFIWKSF